MSFSSEAKNFLATFKMGKENVDQSRRQDLLSSLYNAEIGQSDASTAYDYALANKIGGKGGRADAFNSGYNYVPGADQSSNAQGVWKPNLLEKLGGAISGAINKNAPTPGSIRASGIIGSDQPVVNPYFDQRQKIDTSGLGDASPVLDDSGSADDSGSLTDQGSMAGMARGGVVPSYEGGGTDALSAEIARTNPNNQANATYDPTNPLQGSSWVPRPGQDPVTGGAIDTSGTASGGGLPGSQSYGPPAGQPGQPGQPTNYIQYQNPYKDTLLGQALHGALSFLGDTFGLNKKGDDADAAGKAQAYASQGAIPDTTQQAPVKAHGLYMLNSAVGAPPKATMDNFFQTIDPYNQMDEGIRNVAGLKSTFEYFMKNGDLDSADKVAAEIVQYTRLMSAEYNGRALEALKAGKMDDALLNAMKAHANIPNDMHVMVQDTPKGKAIVEVDAKGNVQQAQLITPESLTAAALGMRDGSLFYGELIKAAGNNLPGDFADAKAAEPDDPAFTENIRIANETQNKRFADEVARTKAQLGVRDDAPAAAPATPSASAGTGAATVTDTGKGVLPETAAAAGAADTTGSPAAVNAPGTGQQPTVVTGGTTPASPPKDTPPAPPAPATAPAAPGTRADVSDIRVSPDDPTANPAGFGKRDGGEPKASGYFGMLWRPDGSASGELGTGVEINGKETEIPLLVPTLSRPEIDTLLKIPMPTDKNGGVQAYMAQVPQSIKDKAAAFAKDRIAAGKSPFADESETPQYKDWLTPGGTITPKYTTTFPQLPFLKSVPDNYDKILKRNRPAAWQVMVQENKDAMAQWRADVKDYADERAGIKEGKKADAKEGPDEVKIGQRDNDDVKKMNETIDNIMNAEGSNFDRSKDMISRVHQIGFDILTHNKNALPETAGRLATQLITVDPTNPGKPPVLHADQYADENGGGVKFRFHEGNPIYVPADTLDEIRAARAPTEQKFRQRNQQAYNDQQSGGFWGKTADALGSLVEATKSGDAGLSAQYQYSIPHFNTRVANAGGGVMNARAPMLPAGASAAQAYGPSVTLNPRLRAVQAQQNNNAIQKYLSSPGTPLPTYAAGGPVEENMWDHLRRVMGTTKKSKEPAIPMR